jgi:hypothetical protein
MNSAAMPSTDRRARARADWQCLATLLIDGRKSGRRVAVPVVQPIPPRENAHHPGFIIAAASVVFVCILLCSIAIAAYVLDPVRRSPVTAAHVNGGSVVYARGAADSLPKFDDRVPQ